MQSVWKYLFPQSESLGLRALGQYGVTWQIANMEPEEPSKVARIEPQKPGTQLSISVPLVMPLDFRAEPQTMYVIPKDRLKRLREANTQTANSKYFGATFAVFLTLLPLILTSQIANQYILMIASGVCASFGLLALFFYRQDSNDHKRICEAFDEIERDSQTIVSFTQSND